MDLRYYLQFENEIPFRKFEIFEPFGADGANTAIEQKDKNQARDVYVYNEDNPLHFTNGKFEKIQGPPQYDIDGKPILHFTHGLDYILDYLETYGSEALISYIVDDGTAPLHNGYLDFTKDNFSTDFTTYVKCGTIEGSKRFLHKSREDLVCNVYADEDLDGNPIIPLSPIKMLLKSKPVDQASEWSNEEALITDEVTYGSSDGYMINLTPFLTRYDIADSLTPFSRLVYVNPGSSSDDIDTFANDMRYILFQDKAENVVVNLSGLAGYVDENSGFYTNKRLAVSHGTHFVNDRIRVILEDTNDALVLDPNYTVNIPLINAGEKLWIYLIVTQPNGIAASTPIASTHIEITSGKVSVLATLSTINSVVEGVRPIDLMNQTTLMTSQMTVHAPLWESGGKHYNQLAINGYGIRNITHTTSTIGGVTTTERVPFNIKPKDAFEIVREVCGDFQVNENKIRVGIYDNFYPDFEVGVFSKIPSSEFKWIPNSMIKWKAFEYKYQIYEQERQEENTTDAVHTDTQWQLPNTRNQITKVITIKPIRDPYTIEKNRRLGLDNKEAKNTSLSTDDSLHLVDMVPIGSDVTQTYTDVFYQNANGSVLKIISQKFNWLNIGIVLGGTFTITVGGNAGTYTITDITPSILTLSGSPSSSGLSSMTFSYTVTGVAYKNRTNEDFDSINGILNPNNFSNILYSIGTNMENFYPMLATASMRVPNGKIKNIYWKSNKNLNYEFNGGPLIIDSADILVSDISHRKKITDWLIETEFYCSFAQFLQLSKDMQENTTNPDIGGYISVLDINGNVVKGYPQKLIFYLKTGKVKGTLEHKFDVDFFDINSVNKPLIGWFEINNKVVTIYRPNSTTLERRRYTKMTVNGVQYPDVGDFNNALTAFLAI